MKDLVKGIIAGILISLGGAVFIAADNRYIGAFLFSLALVCICYRGDILYTGKICYLPINFKGTYIWMLLKGIFGNLIGCIMGGILISLSSKDMLLKARKLVEPKLLIPSYSVIIKGIFCGILIYLAVDLFKEKSTIIPILLCIPAFILSGFEHCVADMFYFACARRISIDVVVFILLVILGNTIGGCLIPLFHKLIKNK